MTLPFHCLPPKADWGIDLCKRKALPTHQEIADTFSENETFTRKETMNFTIRLANFFCNRLLNVLKYYIRTDEYLDIARVLTTTMNMYDKDADAILPWDDRVSVNKVSNLAIRESADTIEQLSYATANVMLKHFPDKGNNSLLVAIGNLYAVLAYDKECGEKLGREIEKRKRGCKATYTPDKYMVCYEALLVEFLHRLGCDKKIHPSQSMLNGIGAMVNTYLRLKKEDNEIHNTRANTQ